MAVEEWEWQCLEPVCMPWPGMPLRYRYSSPVDAEVEYVRHKIKTHGFRAVADWESRLRRNGTAMP